MGKGFTLIEFIIMGIIAAFAFPTYQNDMICAKVTEGLHLVNPVKALVIENAALGVPLNSCFNNLVTALGSVILIKNMVKLK